MDTFRRYAYKESGNHAKTVWVLKCDIRKFFASIDQQILISILQRYISDKRTVALLQNIIESFYSNVSGKGLPLGNLTSQLLVNIYMNEFDQFTKYTLKAKSYIRYSDDFVTVSRDRKWLISLLPRIRNFLHENLKLELHPNKVSINTLASGVNFIGWVHFPDHRVLRTNTKRRMFRNLHDISDAEASIVSYLEYPGTQRPCHSPGQLAGKDRERSGYVRTAWRNVAASHREALKRYDAAGGHILLRKEPPSREKRE
jgi:hypothetical protein